MRWSQTGGFKSYYTYDLIESSGKMVLLHDLLLKCKAEESRVLLFCQITKMLNIVEDYCQQYI